MRRIAGIAAACLATAALAGTPDGEKAAMLARFHQFLAGHEARIVPLERAANLAWWEAATTGSDEAYRRQAELQTALEAVYADRKTFSFLKEVREARVVTEPVERRRLERLYLAFLGRQLDSDLLARVIARSSEVERRFSTFRARLGDAEVSDNALDDILRSSRDRSERRAAWLASRQVGADLAPAVRDVVTLRNEAALKLGYRDYFALQLALNEQNERWLFELFDELDRLTTAPFAAAKARLDAELAARLGTSPDALMAWDYGDRFFQEMPDLGEPDLRSVLAGRDLAGLAAAFYRGIGLDVAAILARSDLLERPGKNPHAFSTDIDRQGDVRVLLNIRPNARWLETTLHELGHAVYSASQRPDLPYDLRTEAHIFATEGVAMLFGRLALRPAFYRAMGLLDDPTAAALAAPMRERLRLQALVFSRWCQVMLRFEKELYANPDQDLDAAWWRLVERYQGLRRPPGLPRGAWASKIHLVSAPVYYHNYQLGDLFASQLHAALCRDLFPGRDPATVAFVGDARVGAYLREKVFAPGASLAWPEFVRNATGEALSSRAFTAEFLTSLKPVLRGPIGPPQRGGN